MGWAFVVVLKKAMGKWHSLTSVMMTMGCGGDIFLYSVSEDDYGVGRGTSFFSSFPTLNHSGIFHMYSHPISKIKRTAALTNPWPPCHDGRAVSGLHAGDCLQREGGDHSAGLRIAAERLWTRRVRAPVALAEDRFNSQHPHGSSQLSAVLVLGDLMPYSGLSGHHTFKWYIIRSGKTPINVILTKKSLHWR